VKKKEFFVSQQRLSSSIQNAVMIQAKKFKIRIKLFLYYFKNIFLFELLDIA
jgi:hypothetical protein